MNKYVRCVVACLSLACCCVYTETEASKPQQIQAAGNLYEFKAKSSAAECENIGDVYVNGGEKGIRLTKNAEGKRDGVFFVIGRRVKGVSTDGYFPEEGEEEVALDAFVNGGNVTRKTCFLKKDGGRIWQLDVDEKRTWKPRLQDKVGGSGTTIYGGILKLIGDLLSAPSEVIDFPWETMG